MRALPQHEVYILFFDGESLRILCTITVSIENDYYVSLPIQGHDIHFSRHASGARHSKSTIPQLNNDMTPGCSIKKLQNFEQIQSFAIVTSSCYDYFKNHKWKPIDGTIIIDMRYYQTEVTLNIDIYALNKNSIQGFFDTYHDADQIHIFKRSDPYLGIVVRRVIQVE